MTNQERITKLMELHWATMVILTMEKDVTDSPDLNRLCINAARVREECEDELLALAKDVTNEQNAKTVLNWGKKI